MNKPKRGKASIKKPTNKKFNTLKKKDLESKRGKKKTSNKRIEHRINWDLGIPQLNHPGSVSIYIL